MKYLIAFFLSFNLLAKERVLVTYPVPGLVEKEGKEYKGDFFKLINLALKGFTPKITLDILPAPRAQNDFNKKKAIGIFPMTEGILEATPFEVCRSQAIAYKRDIIFHRKNVTINSLSEVNGRSVGITRGYPFKKGLFEAYQITPYEVQDDEVGLRMVSLNRLDFFVVEEVSGKRALEKIKKDNVTSNPKNFVSQQAGFFAFSKDDEVAKKLCEHIKNNIEKMISENRWRYPKIFKKY